MILFTTRAFSGPPVLVLLAALTACQPRVAVEAPKEPITINLNIKLDADVRLRLEEEADELIDSSPIF